MKKIVIDKETLYQLYIVEQKSLTEISEILNLNRRTVTINIEDYGFKDSIKHNIYWKRYRRSRYKCSTWRYKFISYT